MGWIQPPPVGTPPTPPPPPPPRGPTSCLLIPALSKQEVLQRTSSLGGAGLWENPPHPSTRLITVVTGETCCRQLMNNS